MKKLISIFLLFCLPALYSQTYTMKVRMVMGNAQYLDQDHPESGWQKIRLDMPLDEHYKIRTAGKSRLELTDGNNIFKLSSRSTLSLTSLNRDFNKITISLLTGKMHCIINKLSDNREFSILTSAAVLTVRGTDFVADTDNQKSQVFVFQGTVEFSDRQHLSPPVEVHADMMSKIDNNGSPSQPVRIPFSVYQEWGMPPPHKKNTAPLKKENLYHSSSPSTPTVHTMQSNQSPSSPPVQKQTNTVLSVNNPAETHANPAENLPADTAQPQVQQKNPIQPAQKQNSYHKKKHKPLKPHFNLNANIGPANINNTNFQQITLMPDFGIGKFGIGLYIPIYMNLAVGPWPATSWHNYSDWDFRGWKDGLSDAVNKFLYIRYGEKNTPPVYLKAGNINNFVIGYGFLMNQYSNMVHFPEIKQFGLQFDITTKYGGFESMVADITRFQILGGRVFANPFFWSHSSLLKKINIGYSHIMDTHPSEQTNGPALHFYGFDAGLEVFHNTAGYLSLYINYGTAYLAYENGRTVPYSGFGFVPGLRGKFLFLLYKLEYRNLSNNFPVEYFDINYENTRYSKFILVQPGFGNKIFDDSRGILGELGFQFEKYGHFSATFWDNLNSPVTDNKLHSELALNKGFIPKIYGTASFDKYNILSFKDFYDNFFDYRTIIKAEGIYSADPKIDIAFIWKRTYIWDTESSSYKENTSVSIETRFSFL